MFVKATPYPICGIYKDLEPCFDLFAREESRWTFERYIVGLGSYRQLPVKPTDFRLNKCCSKGMDKRD